MYKKFDIAGTIIPDAEKFVMENDRLLFEPFFKAAEEFCAANGVFIGGKVGMDLLTGANYTKDSFTWELYANNPYNTTKKFADALFRVRNPHVSSETIEMETNIRHREFTVKINTRYLFKIYGLDVFRKIPVGKLFRQVRARAYFSGIDILCIPEELQIINIYRTLYSPSHVSEWDTALSYENKLYNNIINSKPKDFQGGAKNKNSSPDGQDDDKLLKYIKSREFVIIGHTPGESRLQVIAQDHIDDIVAAVGKIEHGMTVFSTNYSLMIPMDFQTTKHTIFAVDKYGDTSILMDVYNSAEFELIPFVQTANGREANPWVKLRFLFIELWVATVTTVGKDSHRISKITREINSVRSNLMRTPESINKSFQLTDYYGISTNEIVEKKKIIKEIGERFPNYYPFLTHSEKTGGVDTVVDTDTEGDSFMDIINGPKSRHQSRPINITAYSDVKREILGSAGYVGGSLEESYEQFRADSVIYSGLSRKVEEIRAFTPYLRAGTYYSAGGRGLAGRKSEKSPDGAVLVSLFGVLRNSREPAQIIKEIAQKAAPDCVILLTEYDITSDAEASLADFDRHVRGDDTESVYLTQVEIHGLMTANGFKRAWFGYLNPKTKEYGAVFRR